MWWVQQYTEQVVTVWPRYQDVDRPWQVQLCDGWGRRFGRNPQPCSKKYDGHLCKTWEPWINFTSVRIQIYYKFVTSFWQPVPKIQDYHSRAKLRMHLPSKPHLTSANLGAEDGYGELGTRFKASHVKLIVWWLSKESQQFADSHPDDPRTQKII